MNTARPSTPLEALCLLETCHLCLISPKPGLMQEQILRVNQMEKKRRQSSAKSREEEDASLRHNTPATYQNAPAPYTHPLLQHHFLPQHHPLPQHHSLLQSFQQPGVQIAMQSANGPVPPYQGQSYQGQSYQGQSYQGQSLQEQPFAPQGYGHGHGAQSGQYPVSLICHKEYMNADRS